MSLAVDVIMHESVVNECFRDRRFRRDVSQLALDSVVSETRVQTDENIVSVDTCAYKGGRGDKKDVPVLFPLRISKDGAITTLRHTGKLIQVNPGDVIKLKFF